MAASYDAGELGTCDVAALHRPVKAYETQLTHAKAPRPTVSDSPQGVVNSRQQARPCHPQSVHHGVQRPTAGLRAGKASDEGRGK